MSVDLYWLPLGAGGHFVRLNGLAYEAIVAGLQHRRPLELYHSALLLSLPEDTCVIEVTPIPDEYGARRGVVAEGPVGSRWLRGLRVFRYEVRRWRGGAIPDVAYAVDSPRRLTDDPEITRRIHDLVPEVPTPVWGLDELGCGEMWNSNSVVSWLIARGGLDIDAVRPPAGGRAPGWDAGIVVARRELSGRAASAGAAGRLPRRRARSESLPSRKRATSGGSAPRR